MLFGSKYETRLMVESTEVQPQRLTFAQSVCVCKGMARYSIIDFVLVFEVLHIFGLRPSQG